MINLPNKQQILTADSNHKNFETEYPHGQWTYQANIYYVNNLSIQYLILIKPSNIILYYIILSSTI